MKDLTQPIPHGEVKTVIIAEIGSSPAPAWDFEAWCQAAQLAGATHVKAQMFYADHFPRAEWASKQPLEFPRSRLTEFVDAAHQCGLRAGVSVFDNGGALLASQYCDFVKLAAREQENVSLRMELMQAARSRGRAVYRSLSNLNLDYTGSWYIPLYAIQAYPSRMIESLYRLRDWSNRAKSAHLKWGWSSHTHGDLDCISAAKLGASVIEKHLCLADDDLEAGHSLNPEQFHKMVVSIQKGAK